MLVSMIPAKVRLLIDWIHIREAERRGRRVTPVELALIEQSRFTRFELQPDAVLLENPETGESVRYLPCPEMTAFLEQFSQAALLKVPGHSPPGLPSRAGWHLRAPSVDGSPGGTATYPTSFILSRIPEEP